MAYDYLIVGAGIFGASVSRILADYNKRCLVIDRRSHIAGNIYTERQNVLTFTNMERIFSIRITSKFGISLTDTQNSIITDTLSRLIITVRFTICRLI